VTHYDFVVASATGARTAIALRFLLAALDSPNPAACEQLGDGDRLRREMDILASQATVLGL
jgi:hypothetical protein